jgi:hypothetical protein
MSVATVAAGQEATPTAPASSPAPDEVIVFEDHGFGGASMTLKAGAEVPNLARSPGGNWAERISSLKVGDNAVAVLFSVPKFHGWCLGLLGRSFRGSGSYPDLSKIKTKDMPVPLDNRVRSIRILGAGADVSKACQGDRR